LISETRPLAFFSGDEFLAKPGRGVRVRVRVSVRGWVRAKVRVRAWVRGRVRVRVRVLGGTEGIVEVVRDGVRHAGVLDRGVEARLAADLREG